MSTNNVLKKLSKLYPDDFTCFDLSSALKFVNERIVTYTIPKNHILEVPFSFDEERYKLFKTWEGEVTVKRYYFGYGEVGVQVCSYCCYPR